MKIKKIFSKYKELYYYIATRIMMISKLKEIRSCFDNSPIGFCILHVVKNETCELIDLQFDYFNSTFKKILNIEDEATEGSKFSQFFKIKNSEWLRFYEETAELALTHNKTDYSTKLGKYITTMTYQIKKGYCACISADESRIQKKTTDYKNQLELYRTMQNAGVFRVLINKTIKLLYGNDRYYKILDLIPCTLPKDIFNQVSTIIDENDRQQIKAELTEATDSQTPYKHWSMRIKTSKGNTKHIQVGGLFTYTKEGIIMEGTIVDITELVDKEQRLANDNQILSSTLQDAKICTFEWDLVNNTAHVSEQVAKAFNLPLIIPDLPNNPIISRLDATSILEFNRLFSKMKQGVPFAQAKLRYAVNSNNDTVCIIKLQNIFDQDGTPILARGTMQHLTMYSELDKQFHIILEQHGIYSWVADFQKNTISISDSLLRDYSCPKILPNLENFEEFCLSWAFHPEDILTLKNDFLQLQEGKTTIRRRFRRKNKNTGLYDWLSASYDASYDNNGNIAKIYASAVNINQEVENEQKYATFKDLKNVALKNVDMVGRLNLTTNVCTNITSREPEQNGNPTFNTAENFLNCLKGKLYNPNSSIEELFNRESLVKKFKNGSTSFEKEIQYYNKERKINWYRYVIEMVKNPYNHNIEAIVYTNNIDKQKTLSTIVDKLIETDYEFIGTIDMSSDLLTVYGELSLFFQLKIDKQQLFYQEAYLTAINRLVIPEEQEKAIVALSKETIIANLTKTSSYAVAFCSNRENQRARLLWKFDYLSDDKRTILMTRQDITQAFQNEIKQRILIENALKEASEANLAKSEFLSRMSHDMRTPMNGIIGLMYLLNNEKLSNQASQYLKQMKSSADYLLSLINDTLDMSKIESGSITLIEEDFNMSEIFDSVLASISIAIKDKNINLSTNIEGGNYINVHSDKIRLQQIFSNIFTNAVKFTRKNGKIELAIQTVSENETTITRRVEIKDNGIGISKDFLPHIFESFAQEHSTLGNRNSGTGLGLPIVKHLVGLMEGTIEVQSKQGVGTTVIITLPLKKTQKKVTVNSFESSATCLKGVNILLCEDHPINRNIMVKLLEKVGATVKCTINGKEGLEVFKASPLNTYSCILMDIKMPVMDGLTTALRIRQLEREDAKTIAIIAVSANAFDTDVKASLNSGMNAHLAKPFEPFKLYETILKYIKAK